MSIYRNKLSDLGNNLQGSEIRRLFAISMKPGIISFAGGLPDPGSFPAGEVARVASDLVKNNGPTYLQYGGSRGSQEAINAAQSRMVKRGIDSTPKNVIITSGSQQAVNLVCQVFVDPGDTILVEDPTFIGALGVFRNAKANAVGVPMDKDGIILDDLTRILEQKQSENKKVKFLYLIPNFQNPTGLTMSQDRRQKVLDIAKEFDVFILEDDPYGELWFEGGDELIKPIKAYDDEQRVIYTSSFSKVISPGLRLGWLGAPAEIIDKFDMAKQMMDVCNPPLNQGIAASLTNSGYLDNHILKLRKLYKSRRDTMLDALEEFMPKEIKWTKPKGGFFIWLQAPKNVNALDMLHVALENNVAYVIGSAFYADNSGKNTLRISFCHEDEDTIREGIKRLAKAVEQFLQ